VGNFRIALTSLDERERLPYVDNAAGLAVRLARARALLHVERTQEAANLAEQAIAIVDQTSYLREYHVLVLDRAALYALAAGLGARQPEKTLADLSVVEQIINAPDASSTLVWPHVAPEEVLRTYRLISSGLEANALSQLGREAEASRALERKQQLLADLQKKSERDEDLQALTLVEIQLAINAVDRGDRVAAARWAKAALDHGSALAQRTQTRLPQEERDGLWLAAELSAFRGIRVSDELPARVKNAVSELARRPELSGRSEARWLEICLALMML